MLVLPPKVEGGGKRNFRKGAGARNAGPTRKEYVTKVVGLESNTFDIGHVKFTAKYQQMVKAIANHIQKDYNGGPDIAKALQDLSLPVISIPNYPTRTSGVVDPGMEYLWKEDVKEAKRKIALLDENKKRAYALVVRQCSPELVSKIQGSDLYAQADADQDAVQLLLIIQGYCCSFDANQQSTFTLKGAKHRVQVFIQGYDVTVTDYMEYFMALVGVAETYGGAYGNEPGLLREQLIKQE
jgi:hypothetical protein